VNLDLAQDWKISGPSDKNGGESGPKNERKSSRELYQLFGKSLLGNAHKLGYLQK
jgi:hypothetical protein